MLRGVFRQEADKHFCTLMRLCHRCHHEEVHGKPSYWTYRKMLGIKMLHDPTLYDRETCNRIYSLGAAPNLDRVTEQEVAQAVNEMLIRHEVYLPQ